MSRDEVIRKLLDITAWLEEIINDKGFRYNKEMIDDPMLGWVLGLTNTGRAQRQAIRALYEDSCLALEVFDNNYDTNRDG